MIKILKVNSSLYTIKYTEQLNGDKNEDLYGEIKYGDQIINICSKYTTQKQLQSILHEAMHAIENDYCFDVDESTLERLSNAIFALIIDNKEFFREILNDKK